MRAIVGWAGPIGCITAIVAALGLGSGCAENDGIPTGPFFRQGYVATELGSVESTAAAIHPFDNGAILVAGHTEASGSATGRDVAVLRYRSDGTLDGTFFGDGVAVVDVGANDEGADVAVLPDGGFFICGRSITRDTSNNITGIDAFISRHLPDGSLNTAFDDGGPSPAGVVSLDVSGLLGNGGGFDSFEAIAIDDTGSETMVIVCGYATADTGMTGTPTRDILAARFALDGTLDMSFGTSGFAAIDLTPDSDDIAHDLVGYQTTGAADVWLLAGSTQADGAMQRDHALVWLDNTGIVATGFAGGTGIRIDDAGGSDELLAIAVDDPGDGTGMRPVGVGYATGGTSGRDALIARWLADGTNVDTSFGDNGIRVIDGSGGDDTASDVSVDTERRYWLGGTRTDDGVTAFAAWRVSRDGGVDGQPVFRRRVADNNDTGNAVATTASGNVIVAGQARPFTQLPQIGLAFFIPR